MQPTARQRPWAQPARVWAWAAALLAAQVGMGAAQAQVGGGLASAEAAMAHAALLNEGRAIVASRQTGLCVLCHPVPGVDARLTGNLAPPLHGVGARLDAEALRARVVDARRFNPNTVMPPFGVPAPMASDAGTPADANASANANANATAQRVAPAWAGKAILSPTQINAVVAYLASLR